LPSVLQDVPFGDFASAGQAALTPLHTSCGSHSPAEARQTAPAFPIGCWQFALTPLHWSSVQGFPSDVQDVPFGVRKSAGQAGLEPLQVSCGSHSPVEARHTVPDGVSVSPGQAALLPVQDSAGSQPPPEARQVTDDGWKAFAGQALLTPSQDSVTSQMPADERHTVPDELFASAGQVALTPLQVSCGSQTPAEARHTVPDGDSVFAGQSAALPGHVSAGSHPPAEDLHTVDEEEKASIGHAPLPPLHVSAGSQTPADTRHVCPEVRNWQREVQHEVLKPLSEPSSHCSLTDESTMLFPHSEVNVMVTKWPSLDCVRPGFPAYAHAEQPVVVPLSSPWRTAASQALLRTEPFHVKVRLWPCPAPLLTRKIRATAVLWLNALLSSPAPAPIAPGSDRLMVPELRAMFDAPEIPLVSALPLQPEKSLTRLMSPTREVVMSRR